MKLRFFDTKFVERLRRDAEANKASYGESSEWVTSLSEIESAVRESGRDVLATPVLLASPDNPSKDDAENARRIHSWLRQLTPALAMEERLWSYLSHVTFAQYMANRWPVENASTITRRYLMENRSFASLTRNGISRLWWAGHLTFDDARDDPYELTNVLFLRQDIHVSLLERSLGKCRNVRVAVLEFLRDNESWLGDADFGRRIQLLLRELNLFGGVALLDTLPASEVKQFLRTVGERLQGDEPTV